MIKIVLAGNEKYKPFVEVAKLYAETLGYETIIFDLGGLGFGIPFEGRVKDESNAKIPCKPHIIERALDYVNTGDIVAWLDSDAIIYERIDELERITFHIGVTVRKPKTSEHQLPINAGVVFVRKSTESAEFLKKWKELADNGVSDQPPLNQLANVTAQMIGKTVDRENVSIKVFPCEIYNNFYFSKKEQPNAKIKHYKSKIRHLFPFNNEIYFEEYFDETGRKKKRSDKLKKPAYQKSKSPKPIKVREPKEIKVREPKEIKVREPKEIKVRKPKEKKRKLLNPPSKTKSRVRYTMSKTSKVSKNEKNNSKERYIYESNDNGKTVYRRLIQSKDRELYKSEPPNQYDTKDFLEIVRLSENNQVLKKALDNLFLIYYTIKDGTE